MVVIVDNVTSKNENGSDDSEAIVKAAKGIERDIEDLLRYPRAFLICITRQSFIANYVTAL